jgi:hypothetical protein
MKPSGCAAEAIKWLKEIPKRAEGRLTHADWDTLCRALEACGEIQGLLSVCEDLLWTDATPRSLPCVGRSCPHEQSDAPLPCRTTQHAAIPGCPARCCSSHVSSRKKSTTGTKGNKA